MGVWLVLWRVATGARRPSFTGRPSAARRGLSAWYSAVTPSSLKCEAWVPNTGMSSGFLPKASRLRCICLATSRSASMAPLRSNLLMATNSAKSSMSIFSSWLAAPYSGVITYMGTSTSGTMAASPWPMPGVSTITRSNPAALHAATMAGRAGVTSPPASRVARLRMNTLGPPLQEPMAFMRMRSPSSAPPDLRRLGSMEISATRSASSWSSRRRRISSSVRLDLPAPPVPVMPSTGALLWAAAACTALSRAASAWLFSSAVMSCASARQAASSWPWMASIFFGARPDKSLSQRITISPIIPFRPMRWPSSGLKMRATPQACSSRISLGTITPPPPP